MSDHSTNFYVLYKQQASEIYSSVYNQQSFTRFFLCDILFLDSLIFNSTFSIKILSPSAM